MNDMSVELGINPRYAAYAKAHGKTHADMMEHDRSEWPGGCMTGFITWMSEKKHDFFAVQPSAFLDRHTISDQGAWTAFLQSFANQSANTPC